MIWVVCDDIEDEECMYEEAYKIAELLIQYGADPNMYIEEEKELLVDCIADCTYDNSEVRDRFLYKLIDLLIENGANCKSYDADKRRKEIAEAKEWSETLVQALENEKASKGRNLDYDEILALAKTMYSNSP